MVNHILAHAASSVIERARAANYTINDVLEDETMTYDLHWYCGQYAINNQSVKYRKAWDRIVRYIEKALGTPAPATRAELPDYDVDYEETVKNEYQCIVRSGLRPW